MSTAVSPSPTIYARRGGLAAVAAAVLMFAGVAGEWVTSAQEPNGSITNPFLFAGFVAAFTAGTAFLIRALIALKALHRVSGADLPRAGRVGTHISVAGAALLVAFGATVLTTGLATGAPVEASFVLFGLGMLLTVVGNAALGLGLRRVGVVPFLWHAPLAGAAAALVAVVFFADPWHDLGLATFSAAWALLGARLLIHAHHTTLSAGATGSRRPSAAARTTS